MVELSLAMDDGTTQRLSLPVEIWFAGARYTVLIPGPKRVRTATIDPKGWYPDVRRENNYWPISLKSSEQ